MHKFTILICLFWLAIGIVNTASAGGDVESRCLELLPSVLMIDHEGIVLPGASNNIRAQPGISGNPEDILGVIPEYEVFIVLDGPECNGEYVWWKVNYQGLEGWTAEGSTVDGYFVTHSEDGYPVIYGENRDSNYYAETSEEIHADTDNRFSFRGVSITIPDASGAISGFEYGSINPYNTDGDYSIILPAHISLIYDTRNEYYFAIDVFSAEAYNAYYPGTIEQLRTQLDEQLDNNVNLRDLWLMNAAIMMRACDNYIDTSWGTMARMLLDFGQSIEPIGEHYTYYAIGLTSDNRYFIRVTSSTKVDMPQDLLDVGMGGFPHDSSEEEQQAYLDAVTQVYLDSIAFLNEAPQEAFTPRLETLDEILASIQISPDTLSDQWDIPQELIDFPRVTAP